MTGDLLTAVLWALLALCGVTAAAIDQYRRHRDRSTAGRHSAAAQPPGGKGPPPP